MSMHDHSKLEPYLKDASINFREKDFTGFSLSISNCIHEMKDHIIWEKEAGIIKELRSNHPELSEHIAELEDEHRFFLVSLQEIYALSKKNDDQAFELYVQFLKLRSKHVEHEDELYINSHTLNLH